MNLFFLLVLYFVSLVGVILLLNFFGLGKGLSVVFGFVGITYLFARFSKT